MNEFIPNTPTVNQDRKYYTDWARGGGTHARGRLLFVKEDSDIARGNREAVALKELESRCQALKLSSSFFPRVERFDQDAAFVRIYMDLCPGETIENLRNQLSPRQKISILHQLFQIHHILQTTRIIHGDINESNLIYEKHLDRLYLIDFEMARWDDALKFEDDFYGPPYGILHVLKYLKIVGFASSIMHNKTGNQYFIMGESINATNANNGQKMIEYQNEKGEKFVREESEFFNKFTIWKKM